MNTKDIDELAQERVVETLEYLDNAPMDITSAIYHDILYSLAYNSVIDDLIAEAESKREEEKLRKCYEQNC